MPATPGRPNLPGISAPALGAVSVAVAVALSVALPVALVLLAGDLRRFRRPGRVAAAALLVLVLGVDLAYGWAWASTDRSRLARTIVWQESDVSDYRRFPARPVPTRPPAFRFRRSPAADRLPVATVPVRQGGRLAERDLEGFLRSTGTEAFLAVRGDTLVFEAYFHGYRHDSRVSSFSVAKPVVSALVGIAIAQGRIGSVDDPVTRYLPELADRDPRFGTITLRHLLTMSSGLADLDPYYDLDLRAVALRDTRIAGPAGRRFHYNNVNPVLLGMVLERATGRTVSTYLSERLWGRWAWRPTAPGAWTAAARGWNCSRPVSTAGPSTSPSSAPSTCTGASGGDASSSRAAGSPTRPGPTPGPTPRPGSSTTGGPDPGPAPATTSGPRATTASSSTSPPAATWSWSASAPATTTTTGRTCWPPWPAASEPNRATRETAVHDEPVTRGYVVGPGEGVPDQGPEVKASGRSTGGSLTLIEPGRVWTIQRAYGCTRS